MVVNLGERCSRIWRGRRVASPGRWSPRCAGCPGTLTHPAADGAAHLCLLLDQYAPWRGRLIGASSRESSDASARGRLMVNNSSSSAQSIVRWRRSPLNEGWVAPAGPGKELLGVLEPRVCEDVPSRFLNAHGSVVSRPPLDDEVGGEGHGEVPERRLQAPGHGRIRFPIPICWER
jgi:hypothetical protein